MKPRVLAISSGGGHWVQLLRLRPAFENCKVTFATVSKEYKHEVEDHDFRLVLDSNMDQKFRLFLSLFSVIWIILKERPNTIVSTGAAPGYFAVWFGKLIGKKTVWIDSIANGDELSLSGKRVGAYADLWLTQWKHLEKPGGPTYSGSVLD